VSSEAALQLKKLRMPTPARADRVTVEELMRWAAEGRLRLPAFQRPLKWEGADKRALLDSMERGYPVGTLLLWRRSVRANDLGKPLVGGPSMPKDGDVYLVVDGQQRVSTLWEALCRQPQTGERAMVFEPNDDDFAYRLLSAKERIALNDPEITVAGARHPALPLCFALDAAVLSEWVPMALPREVRRRYFDVGKRIREYPLPIYVVEGDDVDVLREVFDRTNSTGKALARDEVFDALVGSKVIRGESAGLAIVNDTIRTLGFGELETSLVLKVFEALQGTKIGKSDPRALDPEVAEQQLGHTGEALKRAIGFLVSVGVPHAVALPYELPLVVLAKFFGRFTSPTARSTQRLGWWLWRGTLAGKLGGASGSLQQHVDDVAEAPDDESAVSALLDRSGRASKVQKLGGKLSLSTARGKVLLCALWSLRPRHLRTGQLLSAVDVFDRGLEAALREITPRKDDADVGHLLMHPGRGSPRELIADCDDRAALLSHGIEEPNRAALLEGDIEGFVRARERLLERWIDRFVEESAAWDRDDRPSISALSRRGAERPPNDGERG
jgi:hypothetical protein